MKQLLNSRVLGAIWICLSLAWNGQGRAENAVRFSDAAGDAGGTVTVDVVIENDLAIAGAVIPFRWSSPDLALDSIVFVQDRYRGDFVAWGNMSSAPQTGTILLRSNYPRPGWIDRGSGVVAQIRFLVASGAASQWASVDSIYETSGGVKTNVTQFSDISGLKVIYPVVYGGRVTIGAPQGLTNMSVVPDRLEFHALLNGPSPPSQSVSVRSLDGPPVSWRASTTSMWLSVSPIVGRAPGELQVSVDPAGLNPGGYSDTVAIASPEAVNSPLRLPVTLTVERATELAVTPTRLDFRYVLHASRPHSQTLSLQSSNGVSLAWTAQLSSSWFIVYPSAGNGVGQISIDVDTLALGVGEYHDTIRVVAQDAANSPVKIPVTLSVDTAATVPPPYSLSQNRPNPFSTYHDPSTSLAYTLASSDHVSIVLYDVLGRVVRHLVEGEVDAGAHVVTWDGRDDHGRNVASGHYFYRMTTSAGSATRQMVLIK